MALKSTVFLERLIFPSVRLLVVIVLPMVTPVMTGAVWGQTPSENPDAPTLNVLGISDVSTRSDTDQDLNTSSYILGAGDQLNVTVLSYDEFTGTFVILPDGTITLPVIGDVLAAGKTSRLVADEITTRLAPFLIEPVVTVRPTALRAITIMVSGEVQRPGLVEVQGLAVSPDELRNNQNTPDNRPTLSSAIALAGGITRNADIREVVINRQQVDGSSESQVINLWDEIWTEGSSENLLLRDGDSIFIPKLSEDDPLDRRLLARSSFAPETVRVRVVGEVSQPGEVLVPPNSTLSSAVAIAGGPTREASLRRSAYIRLNDSGEIVAQSIDLRGLSDDIQIQEGDVVIVPERRSSAILDFAFRALRPLGIVFDAVNVLGD